jgi:mevalonate kinase
LSVEISVPGKSFLAGEYLALSAGPALLFMSEPRFHLSAKVGTGILTGVHQDSPAGKLWAKEKSFFSQFDIEFKDAYQGRGGFGASTAQFLAIYAVNAWRESVYHEPQKLLDYKHLLDTYYRYAWDGQGTRPSGADLIGQLKGSFTFFDKGQGKISITNWPFENLNFVLVHTGNKLPTHEHLKTLKEFSPVGLEKAFAQIQEGFDTRAENTFLAGIQGYAAALKELGFTCEPTLNLLSEIAAIPGVKAAKGCGALGADVLFIIFEKSQTANVVAAIEKKGLNVMAKANQASSGLEVHTV